MSVVVTFEPAHLHLEGKWETEVCAETFATQRMVAPGDDKAQEAGESGWERCGGRIWAHWV